MSRTRTRSMALCRVAVATMVVLTVAFGGFVGPAVASHGCDDKGGDMNAPMC